jgi:hypothetical protein
MKKIIWILSFSIVLISEIKFHFLEKICWSHEEIDLFYRNIWWIDYVKHWNQFSDESKVSKTNERFNNQFLPIK